MYSEETIRNAGDLAGLLMTNDELSQMLGIPLPRLRIALSDENCPLGHAIRNGRLKTTAELNRAQIDLALRGSSAAQDAVADLIRKTKA